MDELDRVNDQLNTDPPSEETAFDVDDIIAEFGSQADAPAQADEAEETVRIWSPKKHKEAQPETPDEPEHAAEPEAKEPEGSPAEAPEEAEAQPEPEEPEAEAAPEQPEAAEDAPAEKAPREKPVPLLTRLAQRRAQLLEAQKAPVLPPEQARAEYLQRRGRRRLPLMLSWLLTAIAAAAVLLPLQPWLDLSSVLTPGIRDVICIGALLCQLLLSLPVLTRGIQRILTLRFSKESFLVLTLLVVLAHGFRCLLTGNDGCALCAVAALLLTVAQQGDDSVTFEKATCLTRALSMDAPMAAVRCEKLWDGRDCIARCAANPEAALQTVEETPSSEKALSVSTLLLTALTFAAALIAAVKGGRDFLWSWSILLLGACPIGAFWAYGRNYRSLNKRLASAGAVVPGWGGARRLDGSAGVLLRDEDLFPGKTVTLNGVKVFGAHSPERLLGYAAAMLDLAGSGAAAAFSESLELRNGRRFHTDHFRVYDVGGLGAEIQGDVVLLGSRSFLKTMGVEVPDEARVAQALYISLNGEAAGLFALRYSASDPVRNGLASLLTGRGLHPILATRDALLTAENVGRIFKLSPDRLEFPVLRDRVALSEPDAAKDGLPCALLSRSSFLSYSAAITNGRRFCRRFRQTLRIAALSSVIGLLTMVLLALMGAVESASAAHLLLYHLVWLIPSLWVSSTLGN